MKAFSSSVINKSGKKFAPKAPVRRAAPAPPRRPSAAQQTPAPTSQQTQPVATETATAPTPEPPASAPEPSVATSVPAEPPVAQSLATQKTADAKPSQPVTAIPIPAPNRKASVSTPIPRPVSKPAAPQPTPPPRNTLPTEPAPAPTPAPLRSEPDDARVEESTKGTTSTRDEALISPAPSQARRPSASTTDIRPSKRQKTTATTEPAAPAAEAPPAEAQPLTPPATQTTEAEEAADNPEVTEPQLAPATKDRKITKPRSKKSTQDGAAEDGTSTRRKTRPRVRQQREPTPEGAEDIEIAPTAMKMSDLCKDLRTGKISKREIELRNMETAEQERKQKAQQEGEDTEPTPAKQNGNAAPSEPEQDGNSEDKLQGGQAGPVMRIVNGEIVLDAASLQVDRHADAARDMGELEDVVENSLTRKVNQASYGKRSKTESWDEEMTDLFYRGLRMFGTDFMMISKMFPGRSRRQIKLKFNNEERKNPGLIKDTLLGPSESIDIATYSEMTNTVYDDPKSIQQELDEEKKRIEDQHAKEKAAQEELLRNPDGANEGDAASGGDKNNAATAKGKRNSKKQAKGMAGGMEEVVGSIDDFP